MTAPHYTVAAVGRPWHRPLTPVLRSTPEARKVGRERRSRMLCVSCAAPRGLAWMIMWPARGAKRGRPSRAERAVRDRIEPNEPSRAEPSRAKPDRAVPSRAVEPL